MEARASNTIAFPSSGEACLAATWELAFLFFQKTKVLQNYGGVENEYCRKIF